MEDSSVPRQGAGQLAGPGTSPAVSDDAAPRNKLLELADRLQAAPCGSADLDIEIMRLTEPAFEGQQREYRTDRWGRAEMRWRTPPQDWSSFYHTHACTQSLDDAAYLLPREANCWGAGHEPKAATAYVSRNYVESGHWLVEAEANTPALALCIACLRARAALEEDNRREESQDLSAHPSPKGEAPQ